MNHAAEFLDALAHHLQSHAAPLGDLAGIKAHTIIADGDGNSVPRGGDCHVDRLWSAMPDRVAERLLHDAQDGVLDRGAQFRYLDPRDNRDAELRLNRGHAFALAGDANKAIEDYNEAANLDPGQAEAYHGRGLVFYRQGRTAEAVADFSRAIELQPDFAAAYKSRGLARADHAMFSEAAADFSRVIELAPDDAMAYFFRALVHESEADLAQAEAGLKNALSLSPGNKRFQERLDLLKNKMGRSG